MAEISSIAQRLLQFSPDAMLVVDAGGIIRFSNETSSSMFGYTPEQLAGQPIKILIPERFHSRHGTHLTDYLGRPSSREMGARISDLFARRADGSEFPAGIRLSPFSDDGRSFVAAAVRDMTERRAISEALVAAREEADRANRAKSRFLATASHDLRQPLQAIHLINASMQKMGGHSAELADLLRRQEAAIDTATRLLNALLDIGRLESKAVEPQLSPLSLAAAFSDLSREFDAAASAKGLRLEFPATSIVLSTDRTLFTQLLQNLIGNAVKYTERGHVRIAQSLEPDALVLQIEDSGMGIPQDKLERIFDEYFQIDAQGTQRLGVGLGLAIVREVSRLLGYSVVVASTVSEGTCVRVRIPRHWLMPEMPASSRAPSEEPLANGASGSRLVLLEDNDSVRAATKLYLTLQGFETRAAGTVAEARALLASMRPGDVFITDYHLDGKLTGLDVIRDLRSMKGRDVPAIVLSGDLQSVMRNVKASIPLCRFLGKPVDTKALLAAIHELSSDPPARRTG